MSSLKKNAHYDSITVSKLKIDGNNTQLIIQDSSKKKTTGTKVLDINNLLDIDSHANISNKILDMTKNTITNFNPNSIKKYSYGSSLIVIDHTQYLLFASEINRRDLDNNINELDPECNP